LDHWEESLLATRKVEGGGKAVKPGIVPYILWCL
jgi:hypothetical protein